MLISVWDCEIHQSCNDQLIILLIIYYHAACIATACNTRSSHEKAVCPSVKRVICDKKEEKSVQFFYTIRKTI